MGHGCQRIKSRNYIVTSSLLSLQPFAKMKIISFSFTDESRPNLYLPLYCFVQYHSCKSSLSFSKCMSRPNKVFKRELRPADRIFMVLGFSPGEYSLKYTVSHISMCHPKDMVFVLSRSKNGYTLCLFWFGIGYGIRGKKCRVLAKETRLVVGSH